MRRKENSCKCTSTTLFHTYCRWYLFEIVKKNKATLVYVHPLCFL